MSRTSKISFATLSNTDLPQVVKKIADSCISETTKKTYLSKIKVYQEFLTEKQRIDGVPREILPLQPILIKECFSFLVESQQVNNIGYLKILLAALRNFARAMGCDSVEKVQTEDVHSDFGRWWVGLQKTLPEHVPQPKKALSEEILADLIEDMVPDDQDEDFPLELVCRDVLIFIFCFLGIQRAGDVCKLNLTDISIDNQENRLQADIYGGKTSKTKAKRFFIDLEQPKVDLLFVYNTYRSFIQTMYDDGHLTPDKGGQKFFVTADAKSHTFNNVRLTTGVVTLILRQRLASCFQKQQPNLSHKEIEELVSAYASHSFRRGGTSTAKKNGASSEEICELAGWDRDSTKKRYIDKDISGEPQCYKKMKLNI
jgi:hypothetical protein